MSTRIAINGFGRIGRLVFRALHEQGLFGKEVEVVAVGDIVPADNLAYLLKYDSVQRKFDGTVSSKKSGTDKEADDVLVVDGKEIAVVSAKTPAELPWKKLGVDYVIESTGLFTEAEKAKGHLDRGRQEGDHLGAGQGRGHHRRHGRQPREVRRREAQHRLQRELHDQLSRAGRPRRPEGGLRARRGSDDDGAQLHRDPEDRRRSVAQGLEGGPQRRHQHHPVERRAPPRPSRWCSRR